MARIEVETDEARDLTIIKVIGELEAGQLKDAMERHYQGSPSDYCVIDLTEGTWSSIPTEKFRQGLERVGHFGGKGRKSALVFGNDADFGIGRMVESTLALQNYQKQVECFRCMNKALEWILEN